MLEAANGRDRIERIAGDAGPGCRAQVAGRGRCQPRSTVADADETSPATCSACAARRMVSRCRHNCSRSRRVTIRTIDDNYCQRCSFPSTASTESANRRRCACLTRRCAVAGYDVVVCRDPGSTPLGRADSRSAADERCGHADRSPQRDAAVHGGPGAAGRRRSSGPRLDAGRIVVADRYLLANVVYQGHAGGLDPQKIWQVGRVATQGLLPDCVFLLDMAPEGAEPPAWIGRSIGWKAKATNIGSGLRDGFLAEAAGCEHDPRDRCRSADRGGSGRYLANCREIAADCRNNVVGVDSIATACACRRDSTCRSLARVAANRAALTQYACHRRNIDGIFRED